MDAPIAEETMTVQSIAAPSMAATPKAMLWSGRALSALFVMFMVFDITIKFMALPVVAQTMATIGWTPDRAAAIAPVELLALLLYVFPRTSVVGAILMTGVMGGAVATHMRIGSPLFSHILFGVYLGLFAWGGLWLRDPRLRTILPWRT